MAIKREALRLYQMRREANQIPLREIFKDCFLSYSLCSPLELGKIWGVIVCHYLNLRVEAKYEGINVAVSPSQGHHHLYTTSLSFVISKLGTVMRGTTAATPQQLWI